jgi:hypothetical protein
VGQSFAYKWVVQEAQSVKMTKALNVALLLVMFMIVTLISLSLLPVFSKFPFRADYCGCQAMLD